MSLFCVFPSFPSCFSLLILLSSVLISFKLIYWGFPDASVCKESACNAGAAGDTGSIPGSERSSGGENGNLLQYSCLENPMDEGAWWAVVHGVAKSQTWLSDFTHWLTHPSILAWRILWTWKPGGLQSMGSRRVGHDWEAEHMPKYPVPTGKSGASTEWALSAWE